MNGTGSSCEGSGRGCPVSPPSRGVASPHGVGLLFDTNRNESSREPSEASASVSTLDDVEHVKIERLKAQLLREIEKLTTERQIDLSVFSCMPSQLPTPMHGSPISKHHHFHELNQPMPSPAVRPAAAQRFPSRSLLPLSTLEECDSYAASVGEQSGGRSFNG
eukprot:4680094-Pleurochrysis_carterae.AAC.1